MNHFLSIFKFKITIFYIFFVGLCTFSFGQSRNEEIKTDTLPKPETAKAKLPQFRAGAQIGYAYRNAYITQSTYYSNGVSKPISNSMKEHLQQLNNNICYGADFSYFLKCNIGFGVRYTGIGARAESSSVVFPFEDGSEIRSSISEKSGIHYIGAFVAIRNFLSDNNHCFFGSVGAGYLLTHNNTLISSSEIIINDHSAAFVVEVGYDFFITQNFAIGLQASMFLGSQKYYTYIIDNGYIKLTESIWQQKRINLSHLDITLGFRLYK